MRVVLAGYGSRGDVEPLIALAVAVQNAGAEAVVCVPPDEEFVSRLNEFGVPFVAFGQSVRDLVTSGRVDPPRVAAALVDEWFGPVAAADRPATPASAAGAVDLAGAELRERAGDLHLTRRHGLRVSRLPPQRDSGNACPATVSGSTVES